MSTPPRNTSAQPSKAPLRPLGLPRPIEVRTDGDGLPLEILLLGGMRTSRGGDRRTLAVEGVEEVWRIAEEWWRDTSIGRTYYRVIVDGGRPLTLFRDRGDLGGGWFEQRY